MLHWYRWDKKTDEVMPAQGMLDAVSDLTENVLSQYRRDGFFVSTIFLTYDYDFIGKGPPQLFETVVCDNERTDPGRYQVITRYSTAAEARQGHEKIVKLVNLFCDSGTKTRENIFIMLREY